MNLLYFIDGGYNNGVGSLFVEQIKAIHKQHKSVYAATSSKEQEPNLIQSVKDELIPVLLLDGLETHENYKSHLKQLLDYIIEKEIDIVHVQTNWQLALIAYVKYRLLLKHKLKIVYTIHSYRNNKPIKAIFARIIIGLLLFLFVDKIICTSNFLKKKFKVLNYKILLLPLGVSSTFFDGDYSECNIDNLRLVFPARFRAGKNQDILINAFSEYVNRTNDLDSTLHLPGGGERLNDMKKLVYSLGMEKQIFLPGQISIKDIEQYYKDSNIAIISSNSETFGFCIVEPFVLGRCVITRHIGVADDCIKEGINGFFFKNKKELVDLLVSISKNKQCLKKIGESNFNERYRFNWDRITASYLKYLSLNN